MVQPASVIAEGMARCQVLFMISVLYPFYRYVYESTNIYLFSIYHTDSYQNNFSY